MKITEFIGKRAAKIVGEANAKILLMTKEKSGHIKLILFSEEKDKIIRTTYSVDVSNLPEGSIAQIRAIMLNAVKNGIVKEGEHVFCITDRSLGEEFEGIFLLVKIDKNFLNISNHEIKEVTESNVFQTVLNIAKEIGKEGREGRKIGTGFIIGDGNNVMKKSVQLILNPFPSKKFNIMNAGIKETIKEFAQLDGMFIIDDDGTILAAGRYLTPDTTSVKMPGFGTRHISAAAITKETNSTAVIVSESGGIVRVFRKGKLIMEEMP
ncbi:MAG: diadenylate cyclase [Candidatus Aenigmarchaeota archaeon]|nr:diadenylate cyclase [Candidatus Aenigmarchaeota archaeon]